MIVTTGVTNSYRLVCSHLQRDQLLSLTFVFQLFVGFDSQVELLQLNENVSLCLQYSVEDYLTTGGHFFFLKSAHCVIKTIDYLAQNPFLLQFILVYFHLEKTLSPALLLIIGLINAVENGFFQLIELLQLR